MTIIIITKYHLRSMSFVFRECKHSLTREMCCCFCCCAAAYSTFCSDISVTARAALQHCVHLASNVSRRRRHHQDDQTRAQSTGLNSRWWWWWWFVWTCYECFSGRLRRKNPVVMSCGRRSRRRRRRLRRVFVALSRLTH